MMSVSTVIAIPRRNCSKGATEETEHTCLCVLSLLRIVARYCVSRSKEQEKSLVIMPQGKYFTPHSLTGKRSQSHVRKSTISIKNVAVRLKNATNVIYTWPGPGSTWTAVQEHSWRFQHGPLTVAMPGSIRVTERDVGRTIVDGPSDASLWPSAYLSCQNQSDLNSAESF